MPIFSKLSCCGVTEGTSIDTLVSHHYWVVLVGLNPFTEIRIRVVSWDGIVLDLLILDVNASVKDNGLVAWEKSGH